MGVLELVWGARTDVGRRRSRNEDAYLAQPPLFAVADGMGGHARGDVASAMAIEALRPFVGGSPRRPDILEAVRLADQQIAAQVTDPTHAGMGTTLCGIVTSLEGGADSLLVFNIGDSRIYRLRNGQLAQLTHDHSVVQELVDQGSISASEAEQHPERNVVTRSLGSGEVLDIDWWLHEPHPGDRILICSDGLVREVSPDRIVELLDGEAPPQATADALVEAALEAGGRDNVTVVIVEVQAAHRQGTADAANAAPGHDDDHEPDTNPRHPNEGSRPVVVAVAPGAEVLDHPDAPSHDHSGADLHGSLIITEVPR